MKLKLSRWVKENSPLLTLIAVFLFCAPYLILGRDAFLTVFDNLESDFIYRVLLARNHAIFSLDPHTVMPQVMNGLPRGALPGGFKLWAVFYFTLEPIWAYLAYFVVIHVMAWAGMYFLTRTHLLSRPEQKWTTAGVALAFAILPFHAVYGLTVAGLPFVALAFINLYLDRATARDFIILALFPFCSLLVFTGFAVLLMAGLVLLYDIIRNRRFKVKFFAGMAIIAVAYLVSEVQVITLLLDPHYLSHRTQREFYRHHFSLLEAMGKIGFHFLFGQSHSFSFNGIFIAIPVFVSIIIGWKKSHLAKLLAMLVLIMLLLSTFYGLWFWGGMAVVKEKVFLLRLINFTRMAWLNTLFWYIAFALSLAFFWRWKWGRYVGLALISLQIFFILYQSLELKQNIATITGIKWVRQENKSITPKNSFRAFFAHETFVQVKRFLRRDQATYRVGCVGFHPAVAQFNGFYTLDSYQNNYSLEYKNEFRRIVAQELKESKEWKENFDDWGNWCYIMSSDFLPSGYYEDYHAYNNREINNLHLDLDAFQEMGGEFILSSMNIKNSDESGLKLLGIFKSNESPLKIYLYQPE